MTFTTGSHRTASQPPGAAAAAVGKLFCGWQAAPWLLGFCGSGGRWCESLDVGDGVIGCSTARWLFVWAVALETPTGMLQLYYQEVVVTGVWFTVGSLLCETKRIVASTPPQFAACLQQHHCTCTRRPATVGYCDRLCQDVRLQPT